MTAVVRLGKLLRDTAQRSYNGEWDFDAIFNRELYPAINRIIGEVSAAGRFQPRFVTGASNPILTTDEQALICVDHTVPSELTFSQADAATFADGAWFAFMEYGTGGRVTLNYSGITVRTTETVITRKQYSGLFIAKLRDDEWWMSGDFELF